MATVEDVEVDAASGAALALATGSASRPAMAITQTAPRARPKVWGLTVIRRIIWRPVSCASGPLQAGAALSSNGCGPPGPASSVRGATFWAGFTREAEAAYLRLLAGKSVVT